MFDFIGEKAEKNEKEKILASGLVQAYEFMRKKGYTKAEDDFVTPTDLAKERGKSRQYWEKLFREGKISYKETSAGMITTDVWVDGYLKNKDLVDQYVRETKELVKRANETGRRHGSVQCPRCQGRFNFAVNTNNTNGGCEKCGFHVYTTT